MPTEKPAIDSSKLRDVMREGARARQEGTQELQYRAVMEQVTEGTEKMDQQLRKSNYESLPSEEELNRLLSLVLKAEQLLPESHPSREQFAIQEKAALEIIENIKKSRTYLLAMENADKNIRQLEHALKDKQSLAQVFEGLRQEAGSAEEKEYEIVGREMTEDELEKIRKEIEDPIFNTLPKYHPLRKKYAAFEQVIRKQFDEAMKISASRSVELKKGDTFEKRKEDESAKTLPDVGAPPAPPEGYSIPEQLDYAKNPPPEKIDMADLVPEEMKGKMKPTSPSARPVPERKRPDSEAYERSLGDIERAVNEIEHDLNEAAGKRDLDGVETGLGQAMNLSYDLQSLRNRRPLGADDRKEKELEQKLDDMGVFGNEQAQKIKERRSMATVTSIPRVPAPPYRMRYTNAGRRTATLAVAPAPAPMPEANVQARPMQSVPGNIAGMSEDEKLAYLEELLTAFQSEHTRLVDEHNDLVKRLTEQVKERKLQALRDSLK